jgi:hypothetical protein
LFDAGAAEAIQDIPALLDPPDSAGGAKRTDLINQIRHWPQHPFNPHLIARLRTERIRRRR